MSDDIKKIIKIISPTAKTFIVDGIAESWGQMCLLAELNTKLRKCHFLAQCAKESDGFVTTKEYASGRDYEMRLDLGNNLPGEGVKYKGRGIIQTTGDANYREMSILFDFDFNKNPERLEEFPWAALSAAGFWQKRKNKLNAFADNDDIERVTRVVNGGLNGLNDRIVNKRIVSIGRKSYLIKAKRGYGI